MKANLILFNTEECREQIYFDTYPYIQRKLNSCTVELNEATVFSDFSSFKESLERYLGDFTVIAWDFDNVSFNFSEIAKILSSFYKSEFIEYNTGYYINCPDGKRCLIINTVRDEFKYKLDNSIVCKILQLKFPCAYLKVFGLEKSEIKKLISQIPNNNLFDHAIFTEYLVGEVSITTKEDFNKEFVDDYIRNVYLQFQDYWFADSEETLLQKLDEIMSLRHTTICIADGLTNGIFENFLKDGLPNIDRHIKNIYTLSTLEQYAKILHVKPDFLSTHEKQSVEMAYEMSAVMMEQQLADISLALCGDGKVCFISIGDSQAIHVFKYNFNHKPEYIFKILSRQAIFKLLKKLRENHLYFLENSV